jgi:WD40 repeat protein
MKRPHRPHDEQSVQRKRKTVVVQGYFTDIAIIINDLFREDISREFLFSHLKQQFKKKTIQGKCIATLKIAHEAYHIAKLDCNRFAFRDSNYCLRVFNASTETCTETSIPLSNTRHAMVQLSHNKLAVVDQNSNMISVYDIARNLCILSWDSGGVNDYNRYLIIKLHDGRILTSANNVMTIWNPLTGKRELTFKKGHRYGINSVIQLDNNEQIASCASDKKIKIWNIKNGKCVITLTSTESTSAITQLDGTTIVSGGHGILKYWNIKTGKCVMEVLHGQSVLTKLIKLQDGRIASSSYNRIVNIWQGSCCMLSINGHNSNIMDLIQLDGGKLVTASCDGTVKVWE